MIADEHPDPYPLIVVRDDQPLIGVLSSESESNTVIYFTDDDSADASVSDSDVEAALALAGAWSDVLWDDIEAGLDRIRHESEPSPPFEP